jgi:hypothetical protein
MVMGKCVQDCKKEGKRQCHILNCATMHSMDETESFLSSLQTAGLVGQSVPVYVHVLHNGVLNESWFQSHGFRDNLQKVSWQACHH